MTRRKDVLRAFQADPKWKPLLNSDPGEVWTDNYSNILQVLRWR